MKAWQLTQNNDWQENHSGFKVLPKGRVVWTAAHVDGDRKRIRISRPDGCGGEYRRYVQPHTEVELVSK